MHWQQYVDHVLISRMKLLPLARCSGQYLCMGFIRWCGSQRFVVCGTLSVASSCSLVKQRESASAVYTLRDGMYQSCMFNHVLYILSWPVDTYVKQATDYFRSFRSNFKTLIKHFRLTDKFVIGCQLRLLARVVNKTLSTAM